jgi:hypothetical protein
MKRQLAIGALLLSLSACQAPDRVLVEPLPPRDQPVTYDDMVGRAWNLARNADDALYVDDWVKLKMLAIELQDTSKRLYKANDVPPNQKNEALPQRIDVLGKAADVLLTAAKDQKERDATTAVRDIHNAVFALKPAKPELKPLPRIDPKEPPPPTRPN